MHALILILMLALMAHDASGIAPRPLLARWEMPALVLGLNALLMVCAAWACGRTLAALKAGAPSARALKRLDFVLAATRYAAAGLFIAQMYGLGWLQWVRDAVGDWIVIDELLAVAPVLLTLVAGWYFYHPIDRHLREKAGDHAAAGRMAYLVAQVRLHILLVLAPLVAVMAWVQVVQRWVAPHPQWGQYQQPLMVAGFTTVFLFAPVMVRYLWDTAPLPDGQLRRKLYQMCRGHRVGVRQLLLWRTYGGMINGAVMGIVGPLRYILLTDGLLSRMTPLEIESVMAHELGHVRRRHMVWLVVCAMAAMYGLEFVMRRGLDGLDALSGGRLLEAGRWEAPIALAGMGMVVTGWLMIFGWVSRRFERQADTFAVRHLSVTYPDPAFADGVDAAAVEVYCQTLTRVAAINNIPMDRRSWRHGSIRWRCDYLRGLVGHGGSWRAIDHKVRLICLASAALLIGLAAYDGWLP